MEQTKSYNKRAFWIFLFFGVLVMGGVLFGANYSMNWIIKNVNSNTEVQIIVEYASQLTAYANWASSNFVKFILPVSVGGVLVLSGLMVFLFNLFVFPNKTTDYSGDRADKQPGKGKRDFIDRKLEQERKNRLFLHTLSVLQREGRLLDFFQEDLSLYEDEQIGAAVRSIQEDCKKAVNKYINPKSVIDAEEGETITIEQGFDIDAIKLTGNVSGEPPFTGIVKHRGWKAGKKELPKLSDIADASIIVPAEVEIQ